MTKGVNRVTLIGHLGKDPDERTMPNGAAVANISLATTDTWKDKVTGEQKERTEWHRIVFHGRLAEIAGKYLHKGSKAYIEGALRTTQWTDNNGIDRYTTEIIASYMQMLDSKHSQENDQENIGNMSQ